MSRFRNSLALARSSWRVLKADKELILLPVISGLASIVVVVSFLVPVFVSQSDTTFSATSLISLFIMYFLLSYITIFFNAALVSAANERLTGGDPTIGSAIRGARRHAIRIIPWALLSGTVSLIIRAIEERVGFIGRLVLSMLGLAWSVLTFLVLPVMVVEGAGAGKALRKSGSLLKSTWGENLTGHIGLGLVGFLMLIPGIAVLALGALAGGALGATVVVSGVILLVIAGALISALSGVYQTALYHFAVAGDMPSDYFDSQTMNNAFLSKGGFGQT